MTYSNMILASIFSSGQLAAIIAISVAVVLLLAGNIVLYFLLRRHKVRKLCTTRLQAKRNALLDHLKNISDDGSLIAGGTIYSDVDAEEEGDGEETDTEEDEEEEEENGPEVVTETLGEDEDITQNEILAVADMSEYTRHKLGYDGEEYDNTRYYVRYKFGFEAKLRASSDEVKARYFELVKELLQYKGVKLKMSYRGQRISKGNKTLGIILLRGKTLCIALALDPNEFVGTKYYGVDLSDKKRYEKTPMLYKISSERRLEYSRYLIMRLAELNLLLPDDTKVIEPIDLSSRTPDELFVAQALRIVILGEAPELEVVSPEITVEEESADAALSEIAADADDENDELAIETPEGRIVLDRSFTARLTQSNEELKARYSELKNYILSHKGTRCRTSWKRETFSHGRKTVATFAIRGKTLMLYLASDPTRFEDTKYKVENMSEFASRKNTPLLFRVKSDRSTMYAKQLIDMLFAENNIQRTERKPQDYTVPYKSTDALIKHALIKITNSNRTFNQDKKN